MYCVYRVYCVVNKSVNRIAGSIKFRLIYPWRLTNQFYSHLLLLSNFLAGRGCYLTANFVFASITWKIHGGVSCAYDVAIKSVNNRDTNNHVNLTAFIFWSKSIRQIHLHVYHDISYLVGLLFCGGKFAPWLLVVCSVRLIIHKGTSLITKIDASLRTKNPTHHNY